MSWYIRKGDEADGPWPDSEIGEGIRSGRISSKTLLAQSPNGPWMEAATTGLGGVQRSSAPASPAPYTPSAPSPPQPPQPTHAGGSSVAKALTIAAACVVGYYFLGGGNTTGLGDLASVISNANAGYSGHGPGTLMVGREIQPGRYRTRVASGGCYWARLGGLSGDLGDIHANENASGPTIVDIGVGDAAFLSRGCAPWTTDLSAITSSPSASFRDGTYLVGTDISPGTWRANNPGDCYWARLADFGGGVHSILANSNGSGVVTIRTDDVGFKSQRCGTWTKID